MDKLDKNGFPLEQEGIPVRITQTMADFPLAGRIYRTKIIDGEMYLTIKMEEFRNLGVQYYSLETVR